MGAEQQALREALKRTAVALKQGNVPFALGGGYAAWARGAPEPEHDVDVLVAEASAAEAKQVLAAAGLRVEQPPEDWLFKAYDGDAMVDVLFRVNGVPVEQPALERAQELEVLSVRMPVVSATELLEAKVRALQEQSCDYGTVLPAARALREQVDWQHLRSATGGDAFGEAFLLLVDRLGITS